MAKVIITDSLKKLVYKVFKEESTSIFKLMKTLEDYPKKGKSLSNVANVVIKEIKYKKFRFYFITDGMILKFGTDEELTDILIKFIRMSDKKDQQKTIKQIENVLKSFGFDIFS